MNILVTGSRSEKFAKENEDRIRKEIQEAIGPPFSTRTITLIHGGCSGVDAISEKIFHGMGLESKEMGWAIVSVGVNHELDGSWPGAGPRRNSRMLDEKPDLVLAFPGPDSRGTWDCIKQAVARGIRVEIPGR